MTIQSTTAAIGQKLHDTLAIGKSTLRFWQGRNVSHGVPHVDKKFFDVHIAYTISLLTAALTPPVLVYFYKSYALIMATNMPLVAMISLPIFGYASTAPAVISIGALVESHLSWNAAHQLLQTYQQTTPSMGGS